jgi:hypothetical protein
MWKAGGRDLIGLERSAYFLIAPTAQHCGAREYHEERWRWREVYSGIDEPG